jgi:hypothetical protein
MAVTIHTSPQLYTPSDSPIIWTFSSNQTAQANFSYIVDLYVGGSLDSRHQIFPENGIYSHFDASETMQSRVSAPDINATAIVQDAGNWNSCYIIVREYYGTPAALQANATSSTIYPFKAYVSDDNISSWDYTDYTIGSATKLFLTEFNRDSFATMTDTTQYLQIITNLTTTALRIRFYDDTDTLLFTQTEAISNTFRITQICLNSTYLNGAFLTSSYIVVDIFNVSALSESIRVNITETNNCDIYTRITWLNHLGSHDSYTFDFNKTQRADIKEYSFERQLGRWDGTDYVLDSAVSGSNQYFKTIQDGGQIVSGWLTQSQQNSIVKLYESPYKVIEATLLNFINFTVVNASYDIKQSRFEDLFNEVIDYKLSNERKSPRL